MGRETGGDEYVLKEIKASKSECGTCEKKKKTFTLDFYTRDGLSDPIVAEKRNDFLSGRITRIYLF